jgi:hypothetical protein
MEKDHKSECLSFHLKALMIRISKVTQNLCRPFEGVSCFTVPFRREMSRKILCKAPMNSKEAIQNGYISDNYRISKYEYQPETAGQNDNCNLHLENNCSAIAKESL